MTTTTTKNGVVTALRGHNYEANKRVYDGVRHFTRSLIEIPLKHNNWIILYICLKVFLVFSAVALLLLFLFLFLSSSLLICFVHAALLSSTYTRTNRDPFVGAYMITVATTIETKMGNQQHNIHTNLKRKAAEKIRIVWAKNKLKAHKKKAEKKEEEWNTSIKKKIYIFFLLWNTSTHHH